MNKLTYINRKEKWWFHAVRGMNLFAFRYWWLILLLTFLGIMLFFIYCWNNNDDGCDNFKVLLESTNRAIENTSNCCSCALLVDVIPCNTSASESGGQGYHENTHWLGDNPGKVSITYDMYFQKDKMDVFYDNQLVASTNQLVSGTGKLEFYYPASAGKPKFCRIIMTAPESGTAWEYFLACPQ